MVVTVSVEGQAWCCCSHFWFESNWEFLDQLKGDSAFQESGSIYLVRQSASQSVFIRSPDYVLDFVLWYRDAAV